MLPLPSWVRKALVFSVGIVIVVVGIILMPLPGPGTLIVLGGLAILATEFAWAHPLKDWLWKVFAWAIRTAKQLLQEIVRPMRRPKWTEPDPRRTRVR